MNLLQSRGKSVALQGSPLVGQKWCLGCSRLPKILQVAISPLKHEVVVFTMLKCHKQLDKMASLLQFGNCLFMGPELFGVFVG